MSRKRTEQRLAKERAAARAEVIATRQRERNWQAASGRSLEVDEEPRTESNREALKREWVVAAPCNGDDSGPEFEALVMTCFDPHNGSQQGLLDFIAACNRLGMTSDQTCKASWIRFDHLTEPAKAEENARWKIGKTAQEAFGPFNPYPNHQERQNTVEIR